MVFGALCDVLAFGEWFGVGLTWIYVHRTDGCTIPCTPSCIKYCTPSYHIIIGNHHF